MWASQLRQNGEHTQTRNRRKPPYPDQRHVWNGPQVTPDSAVRDRELPLRSGPSGVPPHRLSHIVPGGVARAIRWVKHTPGLVCNQKPRTGAQTFVRVCSQQLAGENNPCPSMVMDKQSAVHSWNGRYSALAQMDLGMWCWAQSGQTLWSTAVRDLQLSHLQIEWKCGCRGGVCAWGASV